MSFPHPRRLYEANNASAEILATTAYLDDIHYFRAPTNITLTPQLDYTDGANWQNVSNIVNILLDIPVDV